MSLFSFFGFGSNKIKDALKKGAIIIDVRTPNEYDRGHIQEAIHIPVDRIHINAARIKAMKRPVVLCCDSGTRSSKAMGLLRQEGIKEVYNGGNWQKLLALLQSI